MYLKKNNSQLNLIFSLLGTPVDEAVLSQKFAFLKKNNSQLKLIFSLLGTPVDEAFLSQMACFEHFKDWKV